MKNLVVLSGAGISAESGLGTFRGNGGMWDRYPVEDICTPEGFVRNPELVLDFYNTRRMEMVKALPNHAHIKLAELERNFNVTVVTQNVDDLHERAGSSNVIHLHGELLKATSSLNPNDRRQIRELNPDEYVIRIGDRASDGSQLRPFIVWFGEPVPNMEAAVPAVADADILLVIGTSLNVYPAANLLYYVSDRAAVYLIDPSPVNVRGQNITVIEDVASRGIDRFCSLIM